jgi:hypothetical protein
LIGPGFASIAIRADSRESGREERNMLKRKLVIMVTAGALLAGLGVASALADDHQSPQTTTATTAESENEQGDDEQGDDEQGAATDVTEAAEDVEAEAANPTADDDQGDDQQHENDDAEPDDD